MISIANPKTDHKFQPGTKVAIERSGYGRWSEWTISTVARVYKNGNFVLEGGTQQWRPFGDTAFPAGGDRWSRVSVHILESVKERIANDRAERKRSSRLVAIRNRLDGLHPDAVTDTMLDAIEAALPKEQDNGQDNNRLG